MQPARTLVAALVLLATACGNGEEHPCVKNLDLECSPLYAPEFDEIYSRTLEPKCGLEGGSCHSSQGAQGALVLDDPEVAYDRLLGHEGPRARVQPGDPACSLVIQRLYSNDPGFVMPPGESLSEAERCVFVQWVADGAER